MTDTSVIVGKQPFQYVYRGMEGLRLLCSSQQHMDQDCSFFLYR